MEKKQRSTTENSRGVEILLDLPGICQATTLKKSKLYELMAAGEFPQPVRLGCTRRKAWVRADVVTCIQGWINS